jgi:MFS family permease
VLISSPFQDMVRELRSLFSSPSSVLLCMSYAWSSGCYVAWTSLYDLIAGHELGPRLVGAMTFGSTLAYVSGGAISSWLADWRLKRYLKAMIAASCTGATLSTFAFALLMPVSPVPIISQHQDKTVALPDAVTLVVLASACGFFCGAAAPLFYELLAEISHPVTENVSGAVASLAEIVGALVIYQVVAELIPIVWINWTVAFGMLMCTFALVYVRDDYRRSDFFVSRRAAAAKDHKK